MTTDSRAAGQPSRGAGLLLACAITVAGLVAWSWPLAAHLSTHTLLREAVEPPDSAAPAVQVGWDLIATNDQNLSLWNAIANARAIVHGRLGELLSQGQCYPMPSATTLGEHMIETGIIAAPWWLLSGDPVASYNLAFASTAVLAAAGMFLFLHRHCESVLAAVVGAVAFAFATSRLVDLPGHPAVVGTHWIPWVLWSFDGVLAGEGGRAVAAFAAALLLAALVGAYPLMAVALVGAAYGVVAILHRGRHGRLPLRAVAACAAGAMPALVIVGTILLAYARVQHQWVLEGNPGVKYLVQTTDFLPGGSMPLGIATLSGLVFLVLLRGENGRGAVAGLVAATLLSFLLTTRIALPAGSSWSLYETLATRIALLDSVRAPGKTGFAVCFGVQALGAIGWGRCMQGIGPRASALLAACLVALTLIEIQPPSWAGAVLGHGARMQLRAVTPGHERIDALEAAFGDPRDRRAVLDLPTGRMVKAPAALLDAAYHGHPTSACYNSLIPPTMRLVYAMAARSHTTTGLQELAAAGFGYVIDRPSPSVNALSAASFPAPARLITLGPGIAIWGLPPAEATHHDITKLDLRIVGGATRTPAFAPDPPYEVDLVVSNRGDTMWTPPEPLGPLLADLEFRSNDGKVVFRTLARGVLPLALAPATTTTVQLVMRDAPATGSYDVRVRIDGAPQVTVVPGFRWGDSAK